MAAACSQPFGTSVVSRAAGCCVKCKTTMRRGFLPRINIQKHLSYTRSTSEERRTQLFLFDTQIDERSELPGFYIKRDYTY